MIFQIILNNEGNSWNFLPLGHDIQFVDMKSFGQAHVQTLLRHSPPFKHDALQHDDSLGKKKVSHAFRTHSIVLIVCWYQRTYTYFTYSLHTNLPTPYLPANQYLHAFLSNYTYIPTYLTTYLPINHLSTTYCTHLSTTYPRYHLPSNHLPTNYLPPTNQSTYLLPTTYLPANT
jgi:hypothetical protein